MGHGISKQEQQHKMSLSWLMRNITQTRTRSVNEITASIFQRASMACRKTFSTNNNSSPSSVNPEITSVAKKSSSAMVVDQRPKAEDRHQSMYDIVSGPTMSPTTTSKHSNECNHVQCKMSLDITTTIPQKKTIDKCSNEEDFIVKDFEAKRKNNISKREYNYNNNNIKKRPNLITAKDPKRDNGEYVVVVVGGGDGGGSDSKHNELDSSYVAVKTYNYQLNGQSNKRSKRRSRRESGGTNRGGGGTDDKRFGYEIQNVDAFLSNVCLN